MINKRFPIVLMLEPLHACNLTCTGCGRIREYEIHHHRARAARRVPGGGGRVRRADRLHLRRRADDVSADRRAGQPESWSATGTSILCTNGMFIKKRLARIQARQALLLQRPPGRHGEESRYRGGARRRIQATPSRASRPPRPPVSWSAPTPRSTKRPTWTRSRSCSSI